jgi:hypothetical protein
MLLLKPFIEQHSNHLLPGFTGLPPLPIARYQRTDREDTTPDKAVRREAQAGTVLITPILIAHFPNEISTSELNRQIAAAINLLANEDYVVNLIILQPGKIRTREKTIRIA